MRARACYDFIEIATAAVQQVPDGRIYRRAMQAGEWLTGYAKDTGQRQLLGLTLKRLGVLNLDPYTAGRVSTNFDQQIRAWQERLAQELGPELAFVPGEQWRMPEPAEALQRAENFLQEAADQLEGYEQGLAIKALVQALDWRELLGAKQDRKHIIQLCRQALDLITPGEGPSHRLYILNVLRRLGEALDPAEIEKLLTKSADEYVRELGPLLTMDLVLQANFAIRDSNPRAGLDLLRKHRTLFDVYGGEQLRDNFLRAELNSVFRLSGRDMDEALPDTDLSEQAEKLRRQSERQGWDIERLAGSLLYLAGKSGERNQELAGLQLIDEIRALAPVLAKDQAEALDYLNGNLWLGAGVNAWQEKDWASAISRYAASLQIYLDLKLPSRATNCLERIDDLASKTGADVGIQVVVAIAPIALRLELELGESATRMIQRLAKRTMASMSAGGINPEALSFLWQTAKGLRFAVLLYEGFRYDIGGDEYAQRLLEEITQARAALPEDSVELEPPDPSKPLDDELLLSAYIRSDQQSGDTTEERLANLQQTFDAYIFRRATEKLPPRKSLYLTTADVQAAIEPHTVVLNYFLGATADGRVALFLELITREDLVATAIVHDFPDSEIFLGDSERSVPAHPMAMLVQSLRRALLEEPGPRLVAREAGEALETAIRLYFGNLYERLEELRQAGKQHLCIVPHGPLHFLPFHLLGKPGEPLADKWAITYLPNLDLLISRRGQPAVRRVHDWELSAIGLSFEKVNTLRLPPIPASLDETSAVAAIYGVEPILEEQATKRAVLGALADSRLVHLSTHGKHNVNAPAFQCLYVAPDKDSDGRLYAYELLQADLHGLDLITLSACETGLGRFDSADNLRGLPASLLLAGAATIIGTLWPVAAMASKTFFTALYRELRQGKGRLEAFVAAQRETRKAFPKYRDWGPFYLVGEWL